jgi:RNA polymerase sigma-70 factor (ECF subfamily)
MIAEPMGMMAAHPRRSALEEALRAAKVDLVLVRRVQAGDDAAFAEIVARHRKKLHAAALDLTGNRSDAEDLVQDMFTRAYRALGRFRGDCSLACWLRRILINLARNLFHYNRRRRRRSLVSLDTKLGPEGDATVADLVPSGTPDPAMEAESGEFAPLVQRGMETLPAGHRQILELRNQRGSSYEEIGRVLHLKAGTVKSRLARARSDLRSAMAAACPDCRGRELERWFGAHLAQRMTGPVRAGSPRN